MSRALDPVSVTFKVMSAIERSNAQDSGSLCPRSTVSGWSQIEHAQSSCLGFIGRGYSQDGLSAYQKAFLTSIGIEEAVAEDRKDWGFVSEPSSPLMC